MTTALSVNNVTVRFAGLVAVSDVSLDIEAATVCSMIGPNGAGKTTLFNAITGFVTPSEGSVKFNGIELAGRKTHAIAKAGVRRTFQGGGLFGDMTVLENVLCGMQGTLGTGFLGTLLGFPSARRAEREAVDRAMLLLDDMQLASHADRLVSELPFGLQRQVDITRALAARAELIMLDEPAVGLSVADCDRLAEVLRQVTSRGVTVLMIEHNMNLVMQASDKVAVLNYGQLLATGTPAQIRSNESVLEAYLG
ncbi:ABC transporter ATP-binding protein [Paraburkholderia fynbosensis]|uniref:Lipopolysaccharide export system ATP-binding protein LptB n=1 Tax=Paraburkholderia fynbosensis TaxID=1200993 RepID=A0A6J5GNN6_9BURK|nr:ABC transporter ATP-binding protein [Paraburkholderia fynbosensis]CAB3804242.1 Lipopolysaccharide export system ATP-binding protein LptB [Paraburkholderia fynbosensis]